MTKEKLQQLVQLIEKLGEENRIESMSLTIKGADIDEIHSVATKAGIKDVTVITLSCI